MDQSSGNLAHVRSQNQPSDSGESEGPGSEPLAIVGMSCRFPGGVETPAQYWDFLCEGRTGVGEIPSSRWNVEGFHTDNPQESGRSVSKWAGFLENPEDFDPEFFGISPREATEMDPQQRMLLLCTWEALEDAGIPYSEIRGTDTGVFVGVSTNDYRSIHRSAQDIGVHSATGNAMAIISNRISHRYDLKGPSLTVDTACSSSLVAAHLAAESLQRKETDTCVVAGINLIFDPTVFILFSTANMMSPTGKCQTFDEAADGYVRAEGAGVVILKRASDALRDRNRIYALIRGTAVNQDGKTSTITVPSIEAQATMLRRVVAKVGLAPGEVDFVEAHGTGTPVGDPIEAAAIGTVFGQCERNDDGVYVGAGKSQIGHLESGAGIAGLMKVALSVQHGLIPPNLNFSEPNPNIDLEGMRIKLPRKLTRWPMNGRPRCAAVNSFGFGGTNACAVLQQAPQLDKSEFSNVPERWVVPVSAASKNALRQRAGELATFLENTSARKAPLRDVVGTLGHHREHLADRALVIGKTRKRLIENLQGLANGEDPAPQRARLTFLTGQAVKTPKLMFVFTGQGSQSWNMCRSLLEHDDVFRAAISGFDEAFSDFAGWSVLRELSRERQDTQINLTRITQPAILAVQIGLLARFRDWGIEPQAVLGHSLGEVAAAYAAGALSLEDTALCIYHRARLSEKTEGIGGIAAVGLSATEAQSLLGELGEAEVEVAAVNGSSLVSLAGEKNALERVVRHLKSRGDVFVKRIEMNYAPHTAMMEEIKDELLSSTMGLTPRATSIPMLSTVTGMEVNGQSMGADYWWRNIRLPVLFGNAIGKAAEMEFNVFLEIGPHAALSSMLKGCLAESNSNATVIGSQFRKTRDKDSLYRALGSLYTAGVNPDWSKLTPRDYNLIDLPQYPWQMKRYFAMTEETRHVLFATEDHPLLGIRRPGPQPTWYAEVSTQRIPWLADHILQNSAILPAAAYVEIMLAAGRALFGEGTVELGDVNLIAVMQIPEEEVEQIETVYEPATRRITIYSRRKDASENWVERANAKLSVRKQVPPKLYQWQKDDKFKDSRHRMTRKKYYGHGNPRGLRYDERFQGLGTVWIKEESSAATIRLPEDSQKDYRDFLLHPVIGDCGLQLTIPMNILRLMRLGADHTATYLPVKMERVRFFRRPGKRLYCRAIQIESEIGSAKVDIEYFDEKGRAVCVISGLTTREISLRGGNSESGTIGFYGQDWEACELVPDNSDADAERHWLVLTRDGSLEHDLETRLIDHGHTWTTVNKGPEFAVVDGGYDVNPSDPDDFANLVAELMKRKSRPTDIASFWSIPKTNTRRRPSADELLAWQNESAMSLVNLVKALSADDSWQPRLWVVTVEAHVLPGRSNRKFTKSRSWALAQLPSHGLLRTILAEMPGLRATSIDLSRESSESTRAALQNELLGGNRDLEVALRGTDRFSRRLNKFDEDEMSPVRLTRDELDADETFRVTMPGPGFLDSLRTVDADRVAPVSGEVEIEVKSVGLNFRDIMAATGLLPNEAEKGHAWDNLGLECSGVISRVGKGERRLRPGDRVMTMGKGCFRGYLCVPSLLAIKVPNALGLEIAATVPSAWATSWYALLTLGRLRKGERVLIHTATGGVGVAALQIAKMVGAEIYATAGSDKKRAFLKKQGVKHIMNSRTLDWAEQIMEKTGGEGVDVVLNSLAGPAIELGLSILSPFGRFLEIGKRDIYADGAIGMKALARNITLHVIDMANFDERHAPELGEINQNLLELLAKKKLQPPPLEIFPVSRVVDAFVTMQQARHIGKVVVNLDDKDLEIDRDGRRAPNFDADGAYLVTGGLGGLGLKIAEWMSKYGAGGLYLVSRSGASTEEAKQAVRRMRRRGTKVTVLKTDISNSEAVQAALATAKTNPMPLRGVIHSAGVLDDALLSQLTEERFQKVLAPKVAGVWNLHCETLDCPLDFFVSFSSISSLMGAPGQANYVAANYFLDSFATWRRAQGLPAQTINWGVISETGMAHRGKRIINYMESMGIYPITVDEALNTLGFVLRKDIGSVGCLKVDWRRLLAVNPGLKTMERTRELVTLMASGSGGGKIKAALLAANVAARPALLHEYLVGLIAKVLRVEPDSVDDSKPLNEMGLDSLTSFELKNRIERELAVELPVSKFLQKPTISGLSNAIFENFDEGTQTDSEQEVQATTILSALNKTAQMYWNIQVNHKDAILWNRICTLTAAISVAPAIDTDQLRRAFSVITRRHAIFRTVFPRRRDGVLEGVVSDNHPTGLEVYDTREFSEQAFADLLKRRATEPSDPASGSVFRVLVFRRNDKDILMLRAAHAVCDGWTLMMVLRELLLSYFGLDALGLANQDDRKTITDYIIWENEYLESRAGQKALKTVTGKMERTRERINLPVDHVRDATPGQQFGRVVFGFSKPDTTKICRFAQSHGLSVFSTTLAGFGLVVQELSGRSHFGVYSTATGRVRYDFEEIAGCLVNLVCQEFRHGEARTFSEFAVATHEENLRNLELQKLPITTALETLADRNPAWRDAMTGRDCHTSFLQVGFSMRHPGNVNDEEFDAFLNDMTGTATINFNGLDVSRVPLEGGGTVFEFGLFVQETSDGITGECRYNADVYDVQTVEDILAFYRELMIGLIERPDTQFSNIVDRVSSRWALHEKDGREIFAAVTK